MANIERSIEYQNADGNMGIEQVYVTLDPKDKDDIELVRSQVLDYIGRSFMVTVIDPITEDDIDVEIDLEEWI